MSYEEDVRAWRRRERFAAFVTWAAPPAVIHIVCSWLIWLVFLDDPTRPAFTLVHPVVALGLALTTLGIWAGNRKPTEPPKPPKLTPDEEDLLREFRKQRP